MWTESKKEATPQVHQRLSLCGSTTDCWGKELLVYLSVFVLSSRHKTESSDESFRTSALENYDKNRNTIISVTNKDIWISLTDASQVSGFFFFYVWLSDGPETLVWFYSCGNERFVMGAAFICLYSNSMQTNNNSIWFKSQSKLFCGKEKNEVHQSVLVSSSDVTYAGLTDNHKD